MFLVLRTILSIENMSRNLTVETLTPIPFYKRDKDIYSLNLEYANLLGFWILRLYTCNDPQVNPILYLKRILRLLYSKWNKISEPRLFGHKRTDLPMICTFHYLIRLGMKTMHCTFYQKILCTAFFIYRSFYQKKIKPFLWLSRADRYTSKWSYDMYCHSLHVVASYT